MTVEALWADICQISLFERGWVTLNANFRGKGASPTIDFWRQESRVPELLYGEKKLPKSSTAWVGCTNVTDNRQQTDRQTDRRLIAYSIRNVIRWRLLKTVKKSVPPECNSIYVRRRYTGAVYAVVVCPSVCPFVCLSHAGVVTKRLNLRLRKELFGNFSFPTPKILAKVERGQVTPNGGAQ